MPGVEDILAFEGRFGGRVVLCGEPDDGAGAAHSARGAKPPSPSGGRAESETAPDGGLVAGGLHEWFGVAASSAGAFVGSDRSSRGDWMPPLLPMVHLVNRFLREGGSRRRAVWVGRRCFPYGGVLVEADGDARGLEHSIFVPADRPADRLWAVDLALRCPAVGVVVADGSGFDLSATRRVQLVARNHEVPALLARPPWEVGKLSAARTQWWVCWEDATKRRSREAAELRSRGATKQLLAAVAGGMLRDEVVEGGDEADVRNPRWSIELLRYKGGQPEGRAMARVVEWDRGQGALRVLAPLAGATGKAEASAGERRLAQA